MRSKNPSAPPELHTLGRALQLILLGNFQPDLSALPPDLAEAVRQTLQA